MGGIVKVEVGAADHQFQVALVGGVERAGQVQVQISGGSDIEAVDRVIVGPDRERLVVQAAVRTGKPVCGDRTAAADGPHRHHAAPQVAGVQRAARRPAHRGALDGDAKPGAMDAPTAWRGGMVHPMTSVRETPPGCRVCILAIGERQLPTLGYAGPRIARAGGIGGESGHHHRVGRLFHEHGVRRGGERHRAHREGARPREIRAGRRGFQVGVDPAHLRRETGAAGGDDVDAGQGVPGLVRAGGEPLRKCPSIIIDRRISLAGVADQGGRGLRLGGRREEEPPGEREQRRRGKRPGGADEAAPRDRQDPPAGGGCGICMEGEEPAPRRGGRRSGGDGGSACSRARGAVMASALGARRSALGARRSALGARRSALGARRSALGARR